MASRRPTLNFVTSDSGLLVPAVTDDATNDRADVTFDIAPATTDGWAVVTEAGIAGWAPIVNTVGKFGGTPLDGDVTIAAGTGITITEDVGASKLTIAVSAGAGSVTSLAAAGDTPMTGDLEIAAGSGISVTQDDVDTITIAASAAGVATDGWVDDTAATWTYASATTFTVTGDRTAVFRKGLKLKLTQTTVKYFNVVSSSHSAGTTTVTITGGTTYTLANAAITANHYSPVENPEGWPMWFDYTPTVSGISGSPTINTARFCVMAREVQVQLDFTATSNATTMTVTEPITLSQMRHQIVLIINAGAVPTTPGRVDGLSNLRFGLNTSAAGGFTNSGVKGAICHVFYEF